VRIHNSSKLLIEGEENHKKSAKSNRPKSIEGSETRLRADGSSQNSQENERKTSSTKKNGDRCRKHRILSLNTIAEFDANSDQMQVYGHTIIRERRDTLQTLIKWHGTYGFTPAGPSKSRDDL